MSPCLSRARPLLGFLGCLFVLPAQGQTLTVPVGTDAVFTTCNYSNAAFSSDPNNPLPWPDPRTATVQGNTATASLVAAPGHAGVAEAWVGLNFQWDLGNRTYDEVANWPLTLTIDFSYHIEAYWTLGTGSGNAGVRVLSLTNDWHDFVGYMTGESTARNGNYAYTYHTTIAGLDALGTGCILHANSQAHSAPDSGAINQSAASITLNQIKVEFWRISARPSGPEPKVEICWTAPKDVWCQLLYHPGTPTGTWTPLGAGVLGQGGTLCSYDTPGSAPSQRFYRVQYTP